MAACQGPWLVEQLIADGAGSKVPNGNKVDFQESSKLLGKVTTGRQLRNTTVELTSVSDLVLGIFVGVGFDAVGVTSRLADGAPLKCVLPIVTDFGVALEGAIVCK
jgi:hypothetical protein